ncbi:MAG: M28 family metallopeptidase, partial [Vicinamibacterales bacterium]
MLRLLFLLTAGVLTVIAADGLPPIDGDAILAHIKVLASDEYEGRAPGTKGEELTVKYLVDQFQKLGLTPGNTNGTYIQNVPLVGITPDPSMALTFRKGAQSESLKFKDDFVAWTKRVSDSAALDDSELVFVGYGIEAPEFTWDDYKGVDLKGKTMVVLINDPPLKDEKMFGGKAMTYYGRWTYKFETGAKKGASGILIVHETTPAGYPFSVLQSSSGERFDLVTPDKNMWRASVEGWISLERAKRLFAMAGQDLDALKARAATREFKPVPLGVTANVQIKNKLRTLDSRNVVARLDGSDPKLKDEYVVYTAHWDHLGVGPEVKGDKIYNGALDNASGTAGLIEIARVFTQAKPAPKRSVLFLAVTAEEQGLLGSKYYAEHPTVPAGKIAANINYDSGNIWGRTRDATYIGKGRSTLDPIVEKVAA